MLFIVTHTTTYTYSHPVFLDLHAIRLRPRDNGTQRVQHFALHIDPSPTGMSEGEDVEGNNMVSVWFTETTQHLRVTSSFSAETLRSNPFDYLVTDPSFQKLPVSYADDVALSLDPYRIAPVPHDSVCQFAQAVAVDTGYETLPFLTKLNDRIHAEVASILRECGDPQPAEMTLAGRQGACRDLAVLFIEACRVLGLAARFVSGYQAVDGDQKPYTHAWAEVYIPGGGWRGYDPTLGLAVADRHVAVAVGRTAQLAAPISGNFRGTSASASLHVDLDVRHSTTPQE